MNWHALSTFQKCTSTCTLPQMQGESTACTLEFIDDDYFGGNIYYQYIYKFALKVQQLLGRNNASNESLITWL